MVTNHQNRFVLYSFFENGKFKFSFSTFYKSFERHTLVTCHIAFLAKSSNKNKKTTTVHSTKTTRIPSQLSVFLTPLVFLCIITLIITTPPPFDIIKGKVNDKRFFILYFPFLIFIIFVQQFSLSSQPALIPSVSDL